jgi:Tol biopolymer transport system component
VASSIIDPTRGTSDIWLHDLARETATRLTVDPADDVSPTWSPDGSRIVFASRRTGLLNMYQLTLNAGADTEELFFEDGARNVYPRSWSSDGRFITYNTGAIGSSTGPVNTLNDLWVLDVPGDRKAALLLQTPFSERGPAVSPNRRWLVYESNETGQHETSVIAFPEGGSRLRISADGGVQARWRRDGKEIFFIDRTDMLMAAEVTREVPDLTLRRARPLFRLRPVRPGISGYTGWMYDVAPDGQRFLVATASDDDTVASSISLIVNWPRIVRSRRAGR